MFDIIIIGCGITGAAAAYELSKYDISVAVLEKENDVSCGASKANSAIIHAGYDPEPNTLMAKLNIEGGRLAREIFDKLDVPYRACGSMVVGFSDDELATLKKLYERGVTNGVPGMELLDGEKTRELEPNLSEKVVGSLLAPSAMICSPWEYVLALAETAVRNGVSLFLESEVKAIKRQDGCWHIETGNGSFDAKYVLNAAGVHADTIHGMVSDASFKIIPDRGEYYLLDKSEGDRVNHVVFQCPSKVGKGTLVAPTVHGNLIVGPNNERPDSEEDVATTSQGLSEVLERSRKSVPSIDFRASIRNFSGIRAAADVDDFIIGRVKGADGFYDLAGIKSPGLSSAPAIAKMAVELLREDGASLNEKKNHVDTRKRVRFFEISVAEKQELIKENPDYGRVICRCETVTEGEILDALASPIPPKSVDAVKRRCNAGMGRCQGGFCGPRIVQLLAEHFKLAPDEILNDRDGTYILTGKTNGEVDPNV